MSNFNATALPAFPVTAALRRHERTGEGQRLDLSLQGVAVFSALSRDGEPFTTRVTSPHLGSDHPSFCPHRNSRGENRERSFLASFSEKFWSASCKSPERPELANDPRSITNIYRCKSRDFVRTELQAEFSKRGTGELLALFARFKAPAARLPDLVQALRHDPQIKHSKTLIEVEQLRNAGAVNQLPRHVGAVSPHRAR